MLFVRDRRGLVWIHATCFVAFPTIIVVPLFLPDPPESALALDDFTPCANFILWGPRLPLVFLPVIATVWRWRGLMCPTGAAAEWANTAGCKKPIPRWIRWEGTPTVSVLIITILGRQGLAPRGRRLSMVPAGLGALGVGFAWWVAIL